MIVLGVDPGIERLGWAFIRKNNAGFEYLDSGVKKTSKEKTSPLRLFEISEFLDKLIQEKRPGILGIEKVFFAKNTKTALTIGEVRGVALSLAGKYKLNVVELGPLEIKSAIAGDGRADKEGLLRMLKLQLKLPNKKLSDDESDAIAIALAAVIHRKALQKN